MRLAASLTAAAALLAGLSGAALAQGTEVPFGAFSHDRTAPVEVAAERLAVNQADGTAVFTGNVVIGQGEMRMTANEVRVTYAAATEEGPGRIARLEASGGVTLVSGAEAAEAREAIYTLESGVIELTGDVVLTQGQNALTSQKLIVDLEAGTGVLEGGVRTILQTGANP